MKLFLGNCLEQLKNVADNSIDSIVTDPPYGLSFMGKQWDYDVPNTEIWSECLRVLKPGGHLLAFFGTRTYHRGVVRIEDAGFEIRDQIQWIYGSGFPKSHNIGKAIDKLQGNKREVIDQKDVGPDFTGDNFHRDNGNRKIAEITKGSSQWEGWGTALKPANEPIVVARKPLEKGLTIAENVVKWGTGAINVDGSRIGYASEADKKNNTESLARFNSTSGDSGAFMASKSIKPNIKSTSLGRWPANVLFDEEAAEMLDEQSGILKTGAMNSVSKESENRSMLGKNYQRICKSQASTGGASRFFYVAKASKRERNAGLEGEVKEKQGARPNSKDDSGKFPDHDHRPTGGNNHPTVKPIKLMEYLCRLVTTPNGTVLDPFMGSGSTGVAAKNLGFDFVGCEMNEDYFEIAKKRIGE